jgi:hypothetical protein
VAVNATALLNRIAKKGGSKISMEKKEIIFFDELGFGWVVDNQVIKKIHAASIREDLIVERTLADLLKRHKSLC